MPDIVVEGPNLQQATLGDSAAEALARAQEAATAKRMPELKESLESAIEAIGATIAETSGFGADDLPVVADALETALDDLDVGKASNVLPMIEKAQSAIQP